MIRIIKIAIQDVLQDAGNCSARINRACRRRQPLEVCGICSNQDELYLIMQKCDRNQRQYRFAPLSDFDGDALVAALRSRYDAGFDMLGSFTVDDCVWGFFSRPILGENNL